MRVSMYVCVWVCRIVHDKRCTNIFVIPGLNVKILTY